MRIILNPTWRCNYACEYCWLRALGWHRHTAERPAADWMRWVRRLPDRSVIDVSGGEPLVYPGILEVLRTIGACGHLWAMTTNLDGGAWRELLGQPALPGALVVNVSLHAQSPPDIAGRIARLADCGYRVSVNVVEHPAAPVVPEGLGCPVSRIPYQPWCEQLATDGVRRVCDAGRVHIACDPTGRVYRCMVALQTGEPCLGTIDEPLQRIRLVGPTRCDYGCSTCYTHSPGSWSVCMEAITT